MADQFLVKMIMSGGGKGGNLQGADLKGARLRDADLKGADLKGADFYDANLKDADLRGTNLIGADFMGADLQGADFEGARLNGADLRGADLIRADLTGADLTGANLEQADLKGARLRDADLSGANLRDADLRDANLTGVKYDARTIWPEGFTPPGRGRMASLDNSTAVPAIGDILVSSWGYDQTNIDFYEVVGISGSMITIQEIGKKFIGDNYRGSEKVMPVPGRYIGKPMRKKPSVYSGKYGVKISTYASAYLWNGMPQYQTAAGYGH